MKPVDEATKAFSNYYKTISKSRAHSSEHAPGKAYATKGKESCLVCKTLNQYQLNAAAILDHAIKFKNFSSL